MVKGERVVQIFSEIEIPALTNCLGQQDKEDRSLCPVKALRHYLSRTSDLRHGRSLLFVSLLNSKQGDIAAQTISNWIKDFIHFTLKNCSTDNASLHGVKAHDVRAQAASGSFRGGVPLLDIMRPFTWKNPSHPFILGIFVSRIWRILIDWEIFWLHNV